MYNLLAKLTIAAGLISNLGFSHGSLKEIMNAQKHTFINLSDDKVSEVSGVYSYLFSHGVRVIFCKYDEPNKQNKVVKAYYCEDDHGDKDMECENEDLSKKELSCNLDSSSIKDTDMLNFSLASQDQIFKDKPKGYKSIKDVVTVPAKDGTARVSFCSKNKETKELEIKYQYSCEKGFKETSCELSDSDNDHSICTSISKY